jgi:hypothetical protein
VIPNNIDEYKAIVTNFDETMKGKYTQIIQVERIQNERWYTQYSAHSRDFKKRLIVDTERRLYHGCPHEATSLIIEDCFNRSFAGVNGILFYLSFFCSFHCMDFAFRYIIWRWSLLFIERSLQPRLCSC